MASSDFGADGRFQRGNKIKGGRPKGALAKLTRSVKDQVLDGIGDISTFVHSLKETHPPAAAGLLARILPPSELDASGNNGGTVVINVTPVAYGHQFGPDGVTLYDAETAKKIWADWHAANTPLIEHGPRPEPEVMAALERASASVTKPTTTGR